MGVRAVKFDSLEYGAFSRFVELLFVFVEAVFVAPRSEELGIAT